MKNGNAIMLVLIMVNSLFFGTGTIISHKPYSELYGKPGNPVGYTITNCNDPALEYINCVGWSHIRPSDIDYKGTTVIMDTALSVGMWKKLEQMGVDIIRYVLPNDNEYGESGIDALDGVTDTDLGYIGSDHGFGVASVFSTVANHSQIVYMAMNIADAGTGFSTSASSVDSWYWIRDNAGTYDIDVVSISWGAGGAMSVPVDNAIASLHDNLNIYLISGIGNVPINLGMYFPNVHKNMYTVGSVDHETRGKLIYWGYGYWSYDSDYYSKKGYYSGTAVGSELLSAYGSNKPDEGNSLDFVMPGHGVPYFSYSHNSWYYGMGTSYSAPYLAAAALIAVYAFNMGYYIRSASYQDPTAGQIHELLKSTASQSTSWTQRMGYGYIDLMDLYNNAYNLGYTSAPGSSCNPFNCIQ